MSRTILVASPAELRAALASATGGETILLAPGDYGALHLSARTGINLQFAAEVTIASADPENPASFSGLDLRGVSNLAFENLLFDYTFKEGDPLTLRPFSVSGSHGIRFENNEFRGDVASGMSTTSDGYGTGVALSVATSSDVVIEGNTFHSWMRALVVTDTDRIEVRGNEVYDIRSDGFNFVAVQGVVIEDNHLHNFRPSRESGDHADMIQFWTNGSTRPSTDIVIRNNVLDVGEGGWTQSIFMRNDMVDRGLAGEEMFYRNVLIEDNTIYNQHAHGITVGETDGLVIRNNTVLHADPTVPLGTPVPSVQVPLISVAVASTDVTIEHNAVSAIRGWSGQSDWTVGMNAFVQGQDPLAPGYYGDVFLTSSLQLENGRHDFKALPGGMLDLLQAGANDTFVAADAGLVAAFHVVEDPDNPALRTFDASFSMLDGKPVPEGAQFVWTFSDGITLTGSVVTHPFPAGGHHDVTLTIRLPDGTVAEAGAPVSVTGSSIVTLGDSGFVATAFGADTLVTPVNGDGLALGAPGVAASIGRSHIEPLRSADSFEIDFSLTAARPDATGEVFRLHGSFIVSVTSRGELNVRLFTDAGEVRLTTTGAAMTAPGTRDVQMRVEDGRLSVTVDGVEVGAAAVPGDVIFLGGRDFTFGNAWGGANFAATLTDFGIRIDIADYVAAQVLHDAAREAALSPTPETATPELPAGGTSEDGAALPPPPADEPAETGGNASAGQDTTWQNTFYSTDWTGYALPLYNFTKQDSRMLKDDAALVQTEDGLAIRLDGDKDHVALGRMQQFEQSDRIGFSIDFTRTDVGSGEERLVWNHQKVGLTLDGDAIVVHAATADGSLRAFRIDDAGVGTTDMTRVTVMLDAAEDRLQVLVNDRLVLDEQNTDFEIVGGREWGWSLGTAWNRFFDGDIHDFRLGDRFEFLDGQPQDNLFA